MSQENILTNSSILYKGLQSALNTQAIEDGKIRFTTDTGRLYLDLIEGGVGKRILISETVDIYTEEEIFDLLAPLPKIYVAKDTHRSYVTDGINWYDLAAVKLSASDNSNTNKPIWFSETTDEQPVYDVDLNYNPSTQILTTPTIKATTGFIGNMRVRNALNPDNTSHTVTIDFV